MRGLPAGLSRSLTGILLCAALSGCGADGPVSAEPFPSFTPRPTVVVASPGSDGVQRVTIDAAESLFRPPNIRAHTGPIEITVDNKDAVFHNLTVEVGKGVDSGTINGKATASVQFTLPTVGRYKFFCSYHEDTGMIGTLDVQ